MNFHALQPFKNYDPIPVAYGSTADVTVSYSSLNPNGSVAFSDVLLWNVVAMRPRWFKTLREYVCHPKRLHLGIFELFSRTKHTKQNQMLFEPIGIIHYRYCAGTGDTGYRFWIYPKQTAVVLPDGKKDL